MSKGEVILATGARAKEAADGVDLVLTSGQCSRTFRLQAGLARRIAGDIVALLDATERKPSNVSPIKKPPGH